MNSIKNKQKKVKKNKNKNAKTNVEVKQLTNIKKTVKTAKMLTHPIVDHLPFEHYVSGLIATGHDRVPTPMNPIKVFIKRINFQDSLQVNANGNLLVFIPPAALPTFAVGSSVSPVIYANNSAYDPLLNTNSFTGAWNTNFVSANAMNINAIAYSKARTQSLHLEVQLTGVSNLNKKGTLHLAEDVEGGIRYGSSAEQTISGWIINDFSIGDLPKKNHYRSIEIMNMDSSSVVKYHYMPLTNDSQVSQYKTPSILSTSSSSDSPSEKRFALIVQGADPGTIVKLKYQIDIECEVTTDFYSDYPPDYSRCYLDTEATLQYLSKNTDYIFEIEERCTDLICSFKNRLRSLGSNRN